MSARSLLVAVVSGAGGLLGGYLVWGTPAPVAATQVPAAPPAGFTMDHRLGANLYVQLSAEHRACCLQTYRLAGERLRSLPPPAESVRRRAVILDLDETVLDNSAFQNALYAANREYTQPLWDVYEKGDADEVALVPGAADFVAAAEKAGVVVCYVSNRSETLRDGTVAAMTRLGLNTAGLADRLFLKPAPGAPSDKTARRKAVADRYDVVLNIGDNLRDFSEEFANPKVTAVGPDGLRAAAAARAARADAAAARWGNDWFIVPNPVYGEWDRLLGPDPRALLRPTKLDLRAAH